MPGVVVNPRSRVFHGHDWIYAGEIRKTFGDPQPGDVVSIKDFRDKLIGSGIYNPRSQIVVRRFSRQKQSLDTDFFRRRLQRAVNYREKLPGIDPSLCRLVWSESDGLPGVVVDRYGETAVLQTLTLAMDLRKTEITAALLEVLPGLRSVVERNDSSIRTAESLSPSVGMLHGPAPEPFRIEHDGLLFQIDPLQGQKTGLYLDQLSNYQQVAPLAAGRRVLDCFCNQGGFARACARAGAAAVQAVDSSAPAVATLQALAAAENLAVTAQEANAFDFLKEQQASGAAYDLIILDPPSFTRTKRSLRDALRGYKELHLRALKMLEPGGILVTFSCSHHLGAGDYLEMVLDAAVDARRSLRRRAVYSQREDHPVILGIPETEYLRGFAWEVLGGW